MKTTRRGAFRRYGGVLELDLCGPPHPRPSLPRGRGVPAIPDILPLSPLGERVDRTGGFFSRGGPGEGVRL